MPLPGNKKKKKLVLFSSIMQIITKLGEELLYMLRNPQQTKLGGGELFIVFTCVRTSVLTYCSCANELIFFVDCFFLMFSLKKYY